MTYRPAPVPPGSISAAARTGPQLKADAIGVAGTTFIGVANAAPTVSVGLTLAILAATSAYASGPVILLCAVSMAIIANAYRRLNLWLANCGASFEWVGRAICAGRMPCQARRSLFGWRLAWLRFRQARRRLRPRPGPSCCGLPGRCARMTTDGGVSGEC